MNFQDEIIKLIAMPEFYTSKLWLSLGRHRYYHASKSLKFLLILDEANIRGSLEIIYFKRIIINNLKLPLLLGEIPIIDLNEYIIHKMNNKSDNDIYVNLKYHRI